MKPVTLDDQLVIRKAGFLATSDRKALKIPSTATDTRVIGYTTKYDVSR